MALASDWSASVFEALESFLQANRDVDWRAWAPPSDVPVDLVPILKAYQRLLFVLPPGEERRALPLLRRGLHSAIQIAGLPRPELVRTWAELFPDDAALGEEVRRRAVARRSQIALEHVKSVQSNEPHYLAARFR